VTADAAHTYDPQCPCPACRARATRERRAETMTQQAWQVLTVVYFAMFCLGVYSTTRAALWFFEDYPPFGRVERIITAASVLYTLAMGALFAWAFVHLEG
jgi:hypothetical protein